MWGTCMTEHMCHHIHYGVSMLSNPSITIGDFHYKPSIIMEGFI